jgi:hypothetical protein
MNWKKIGRKVALTGGGTTRRFASEMAGTGRNNNSSMFHIPFLLSMLGYSDVVGFVDAALVNSSTQMKNVSNGRKVTILAMGLWEVCALSYRLVPCR